MDTVIILKFISPIITLIKILTPQNINKFNKFRKSNFYNNLKKQKNNRYIKVSNLKWKNLYLIAKIMTDREIAEIQKITTAEFNFLFYIVLPVAGSFYKNQHSGLGIQHTNNKSKFFDMSLNNIDYIKIICDKCAININDIYRENILALLTTLGFTEVRHSISHLMINDIIYFPKTYSNQDLFFKFPKWLLLLLDNIKITDDGNNLFSPENLKDYLQRELVLIFYEPTK